MVGQAPRGSPAGPAAVRRPFTFSKTNARGRRTRSNRAYASKSMPVSLVRPSRPPATLKETHGGPPQRTPSWPGCASSRRSSSLPGTSRTSRSIIWAPAKYSRPFGNDMASAWLVRSVQHAQWSISTATSVRKPAHSSPRSNPPAPEKTETTPSALSALVAGTWLPGRGSTACQNTLWTGCCALPPDRRPSWCLDDSYASARVATAIRSVPVRS